MIAMQFDRHAVGEFDPVRKVVARHRDHDRNIIVERTLDEMG
jgi:hypothetical protein